MVRSQVQSAQLGCSSPVLPGRGNGGREMLDFFY